MPLVQANMAVWCQTGFLEYFTTESAFLFIMSLGGGGEGGGFVAKFNKN